ncbi:phage/plasmid primase, P4 family, partial [Mesotoga sp.]|uniref:DNA primase family protein n=1 Tax=Mesotoga sp. TaxID=2053577 RepID=UPI00345EEB58
KGEPYKSSTIIRRIVLNDLFPSIHYEKSSDRFFSWTGLFFDELSDLDVKRLIQLEADKEDFVVLDNTLNNIVATLKTLSYLKDVPEMKGYHIPLKNGSLAVSATNPPKLEQHSPEHGNKYVLPFDYDQNAKCPVFDAFLKSLDLGKGNEDLIQEIFGYFFLPMKALNLQKCVFFYGPGANGKSTMANLLFYMLGGIKNCSTLRVDQLNGFELARVLDKPANIGSEVTSGKNYIDTQVLKSIVSGDALTINRKYKDPIDYVPQCKFLFTVNALPNVSDSSHGFARRLIIIEFNRIIPVEFQDEQLLDKLIKEASGVFNWLLEGIERLLTNNVFTNTAQSDQVVARNYSESNPVYLWAESHTYYKEGNFERTDWLYQSYRKWAVDSGFNALNITNFAKELKKVLAENFGWAISLGRESSKGRRRGFTNIGMIFAPELFSDMTESSLLKEIEPSRMSRRGRLYRT